MRISEVKTRDDLARYLQIPIQQLTFILYGHKPDNFYITFEIPKKSGGCRTIHAPTKLLKSVLKKLYYLLSSERVAFNEENKVKINISHGFEKGKSIFSNSRIHKNKFFVLNIDLQDFFDSFNFGRVRGYLMKNRNFNLSVDVATMVAQLLCYKGKLPQGAPTSPFMTNLICSSMDQRILKLSKKYRLDFTRYADDLTFSTNNRQFVRVKDKFLSDLEKIIVRSGFYINHKKTRFTYRTSRQMVTGLVVNSRISVPVDYAKETRAMAYSLYKNGNFFIDGTIGDISQLEGRFSFINQVDKFSNEILGTSFGKRQNEFKKFLFYRTFFNNDRPVLVMEGKTDVLYIKAALKKLHEKYPELIEKDEEGHFIYKIHILNKTKRMEEVLHIYKDGANSLVNLYKYFVWEYSSEKKEFPNYFSYFHELTGRVGSTVVLLFDNEISNKEKPLRKFMNKYIKDPKKFSDLSRDLYIKPIEEANIYIATHPLPAGKSEGEIEDLFKKDLLDLKIDGKVFSRKDKIDSKVSYGKHIFSRHVIEHYNEIDFSGFEPLLDNLVKLIK